jgi:hypothetical protein
MKNIDFKFSVYGVSHKILSNFVSVLMLCGFLVQGCNMTIESNGMKSSDISNGLDITKLELLIDKEAREIVGTVENAVIFIGDTGEGKSSLINYIAGNELFAEDDGCGDGGYVIKAVKPLDKIVIGNSTASQTTTPNKWVDKNGIVYWDCPGFCDTKGAEQDIANAFYIKKVFETSTNVKTVLVVSHENLKCRIKNLLSILNKLSSLFTDLKELKDSLSLVVTKTTFRESNHIRKHLSGRLIPDNEEYLDEKQKFILDYFARSDSNISLFPAPKKEGPIPTEECIKIKDIIYSTKYLQKPKINITISGDSISKLTQFAKWVNLRISDQCQYLNKRLETLCRDEINAASSVEQIKSSLRSRHDAIRNIQLAKNEDEFLKIYKNLIADQKLYEQEYLLKDFYKNLELLDFVSTIRKEKEEVKIQDCKNRFKITNLINHFVEEPYVELRGDSLYIRSKLLGVSEIMNTIKAHSDKFKFLSVFAYDTIYLDEDLINPGINTSIIATRWRVNGDRIISLKGKDGANYEQPKADDGHGLKIDGVGEFGKDGLPGKAGQNAGSFFGKSIKIFPESNKLTIDVSGGNGARGQHGGDGAVGEIGMDGNRDKLIEVVAREQEREEYLIKREKFKFGKKNGWGQAGHVIKALTTFNDQLLETYRIKGTSGKRGGDSGRGGNGGLGGFAGKIKLTFNCDNRVCENGNIGIIGNPGNPGRGGRNGLSYEGLYVNEMVMPVFRKGGQELKEADVDTIINGISTAAIGGGVAAGTGVYIELALEVAHQAAKKALEEAAKETSKVIALEAAKKAAILAFEESIKQASSKLSAETIKAILASSTAILNIGSPVGLISGMVATESFKEISKQSAIVASEEVAKNAAIEAAKEASKQVVIASSQETVKQAALVTAEQTAVQSTSKAIIGGVCSLGASLALQSLCSVVSAYACSGWLNSEQPIAVENNEMSEDGLTPEGLNIIDQEQPSDISEISFIQDTEMLFEKSFEEYYNACSKFVEDPKSWFGFIKRNM